MPYGKFPDISQKFIDEVFIRTESSINALDIISIYKAKKSNNKTEFREFQLIQYMTVRFLIMEFFALLDGSELSINLHKDKQGFHFKVQTAKLRKLFPSLSTNKFNKLNRELMTIIKRYDDLLSKLEWTRNYKIAHANISWFDINDNEIKVNKKFPIKRLNDFITEFQSFFVNIGFGV